MTCGFLNPVVSEHSSSGFDSYGAVAIEIDDKNCSLSIVLTAKTAKITKRGILPTITSSKCNRYAILRLRACQCDRQDRRHMFDSMMCLLDALLPSSYACHTGLTTGGGGILPPARPGQSACSPRTPWPVTRGRYRLEWGQLG